MSRSRRSTAPFAVVAALILMTAACGEPTAPSESTSSVATSEPTAASEALERPEQQQVDVATARAALPTLEDLPKGWVVNESPVSHAERTYDPPECAAVEFRSAEAQTFKKAHLEVEERVAYSEWTQDVAAQLAVTLYSFSEPFPTTLLDLAGERLGDCSAYERTIDGEERSWATQALTTPTVGDRALGIRYTADADGAGRVTDELTVRSGHNLIVVKYLPTTTTYDDQALQDYAQDVLDRLEKAS